MHGRPKILIEWRPTSVGCLPAVVALGDWYIFWLAQRRPFRSNAQGGWESCPSRLSCLSRGEQVEGRRGISGPDRPRSGSRPGEGDAIAGDDPGRGLDPPGSGDPGPPAQGLGPCSEASPSAEGDGRSSQEGGGWNARVNEPTAPKGPAYVNSPSKNETGGLIYE